MNVIAATEKYIFLFTAKKDNIWVVTTSWRMLFILDMAALGNIMRTEDSPPSRGDPQ